MKERVFITGLGQCSSLGTGVKTFWQNLIKGNSGLKPLKTDYADENRLAGMFPLQGEEVKEKTLMNAISLAIKEAMEDALLFDSDKEIAVAGGSNFGQHYQFIEEQNFFALLRKVIAQDGITGEFWGLSTACASGVNIVGLASDLIRYAKLKKVLVCGYDMITAYNYLGLDSLRAITKDTIRPFDKNRRGTLLGEGVGALILEAESSAQSRNITPYAEVIGYGISNDAYHFTAPEKTGLGIQKAMQQAIKESGISSPDKIDHLNAHGTGTIYNDLIETKAIHSVFGNWATKMPVTSIKGAIGHTMGAAGAIECIATVLSLYEGIIPPTLNFIETDPECNLDYVFNTARAHSMKTAMCNSYGLWGCNASVIFRTIDNDSEEKSGLREEQPIAIVGLGPVSPLGIGITPFMASIANKMSAPLTNYIGIENFNVHDYIKLKTQCLDNTSGMALLAAKLAVENADWNEESIHDAGLILGTTLGNMTALKSYRDSNNISPLRFVHTFINTPGGLTSQVLKLQGVHSMICSGPLAGAQAIEYAFYLLKSNKSDRILCGGIDSFEPLRDLLLPRYTFFSEGAGIIALEKIEPATVKKYVQLAAIGKSTRTSESNLFKSAIQSAIAELNMTPSDIDMVVLSSHNGNTEKTALQELDIPNNKWFDLFSLTGEVGAAFGGLAFILAADLLFNSFSLQCILVNNYHLDQCISMLLRKVLNENKQ